MNTLSVLGKYLDQPKFIKKFSSAVPAVLIVGGSGIAAEHIYNSPKKERSKEAKKSFIVIAATIVSAIFAPKIASKFVSGHHHHHHHDTAELVQDFLKKNKLSPYITERLNKAKEKVLSFSEIKKVFEEVGKTKKGQKFLDEFVPSPENIDSKHIFDEIGKLSVMGLITVLGGITGGIAADKLTEDNWKSRIPNKIKEGTYQYLANIFLCNIGAGAALLVLEKANVKSKPARALAMIGGIILTGVVFGSVMANFIGERFIEPLFGHKHNKGLYHERKPEALDIGLHVDDVATVAVLSGLKWIEPALPVLYAISGYRAGIGYRNG